MPGKVNPTQCEALAMIAAQVMANDMAAVGDETFTIHPGDVLLATDHTGSGHRWRMLNDEPWKRAYVVFKKGANTHFVPDQT
jgi:hypothetical protein